jgi:hypothetical protein
MELKNNVSNMKKIAIIYVLLISAVISAQNVKKRCKTCGKLISQCEFRGRHASNVMQNNNVTSIALYSIGDYYEKNGIEGVIFYVDKTGKHGKIVELYQSKDNFEWCTDHWSEAKKLGCSNRNDGFSNLQVIQKQPNWQQRFPAFAYCSSKGVGWYLPAINELRLITNNRKRLNKTISLHGGTLICPNSHGNGDHWGWYWSSTEASEDKRNDLAFRVGWDFDTSKETGVPAKEKMDKMSVRAIHFF